MKAAGSTISFLVLLLLLAGTVPVGALTLHVHPNQRVGDLSAPPGEPIRLVGSGPVTLVGTLSTRALDVPGASAPSIRVEIDGTLVLAPGTSILAGNGESGKNDLAGVRSFGGPGGAGGDVVVAATTIVAHGNVLQAGDGGAGGAAEAHGVPLVHPDAYATGGNGGAGGVVTIHGIVHGILRTLGGSGGDGGNATASGAHGENCTSANGNGSTKRGANGTALHPAGGDANATGEAGACGPVDGTGGTGGNATAHGGNGGPSAQGTGGHGGNASAIAGPGGNGADACFKTNKAARESGIQHAGNGGDGGVPWAKGGDGGPGQAGGDGGDAYTFAVSGYAGNATPPIAYGLPGWNMDPRYGDNSSVEGGDGGIGFAGNGGSGGSAIGRGSGRAGGLGCGPISPTYLFGKYPEDRPIPWPQAIAYLVTHPSWLLAYVLTFVVIPTALGSLGWLGFRRWSRRKR